MKTQFTEEQKFTQWWVWLTLLVVTGFLLWLFISSKTESTVSGLFLMGLFVILFLLLKLKTVVNNEGVIMSFFPLTKKTINWSEIKSVKVFDYGFVGGWGIRLWTKYGTVYNIKGSKGLLVELLDGKTFVIGTQKEEELKKTLNNLGKISE